ncbi:MAG TPA: DUF6036 family nucleotidyltransferase [Streptosporangiaceae bacterium]|nr:DUF6036 family nucleotidyltransferase [Streptosporangiaceae bacterium]
MHELSREDVIAALTALGARLQAQGVHAQIFIVGGAAMALAYSDRRVTKDIDAVFEPKAVVYDAAAQVAAELGLPDGWLNDAAKGFMPGADLAARPLPGIPGLEVHVGSPRYLLAMKLLAMRFGEDEDDIEVLLEAAGITSAREAAALLQQAYPYRELPPKTWFFLQQYFGGED